MNNTIFLATFSSRRVAIISFLVISIVIVTTISGLIFNTTPNFLQMIRSQTVNSQPEIQKQATSQQYNNLATLQLKLPGMFCPRCADSVKNSLKGMEGIIEVQVNLKAKSAVIRYDPSIVSPETILSNPIIKAYEDYIE